LDPFFSRLEGFLKQKGQHRELVLDLGAGPGSISDYVATAGFNLVAFDIDKVVLRQAAARHPAVLGDAHCLPFRDSRFDKVICINVIEHVVDPRQVLLEVQRVLVQGGRLFLSVPCRKGIPKIFGEIYAKLAHFVMPKSQRERHCYVEHNLSYHEVVRLLESASLHVEHARHSHFAVTGVLAGNYRWIRPLHLILSRTVEALHLHFLTINTQFTCERK